MCQALCLVPESHVGYIFSSTWGHLNATLSWMSASGAISATLAPQKFDKLASKTVITNFIFQLN